QIIRGEGLQISSDFLISWKWFWFFAILLITGLGYGVWRVRKWRQNLYAQRAEKRLPKDITEKLEDLKKYRAKYGSKIAVILLFLFGTALFVAHPVSAQTLELAPPLITTISRNISNEEIFYVGGKTEASLSQVVIYLQNLRTGETFSHNVTSDKLGDWFYRHDTFLSSGSYLLWTQAKVADQMSPPSPQIQLNVGATAIQFGASRISYEVLYLVFVIVLLLAVFALLGYIIFHGWRGRREDMELAKEIREAEDSVKRGFAVLKRDIRAEFEMIKRRRGEREISEEEKTQEEQLLKDLEWVEKYIEKEIWDIKEEAND
ncbi:MAG: hypothetical protein Q8P55_01955, partial [bacterium]|nr:hypothetical protein [bacterium]